MVRLSSIQSLKEDLVTRGAPVLLLGVADDLNGVTLLGQARCGASPTEVQDVADTVPAPLCVVGAFASSQAEALKLAKEVRQSGLGPQECVVVSANDGQLQAAQLQRDGGLSSPLQLEAIPSLDDWLRSQRILRCELPLSLEVVEDGSSDLATAIQAGVERLVRQLEAPDVSYLAEAGPSGRQLLRPSATATVETLPGAAPSSNSTSSPNTSSGTSSVVQCAPLLATTRLAAPPAGPSFSYLPLSPPLQSTPGGVAGATCRSSTLRLDALCYVPRSCQLGAAVRALTAALVLQARAAGRVLVKLGKVVPVRAYHFLPPGLAHHLTLLYPALEPDPERNDDRLRPERQRLHDLFGLPPNRPLLRPANALDMGPQGVGGPGGGEGEDGAGGGGGGAVARLRDVHLGLAAPNIGGTTVLVQGSYEYCHYMQDRFNDSGWGCAYRSLQTICSWFRLQKYTSKPVPSHKTIQQTLVRLDDKPPSFVGSSNWIGAIELSYILDDYLGVTSKILTVNRGADIPAHARELAAHFASVGSPVMIGGGVLAYTLLGVRFNEQTGEAAFLILDPHYTGGEDLKKIHQGTWVGWKRPGDNAAAGGPLFVDDAFYNFLLPQRPNTV